MWRILASLIALVSLAAAPARAEWRRAQSPNFVLYGNMSESALRERILLLEDFDRLLRTLTAGEEEPAPNRLHIYIVSGIAALRVVRPVSDGIAGFYTASPDGILAMVDGSRQDAGNQILFHEYAHHFMMQNSVMPYPAWFVEGFAEYFATARFTARKIDIGNFSPGRVYSIQQGPWLPMERLLSGGPSGLNDAGMEAYYAQSWLLVHYFYSTPERQAALLRLITAQRRSGPVEALQSATGFTPQDLTRELRNYIGRGSIRYRQMDRVAAAPPAVTITTMPRSAGDLILYEAALRTGVSDENGPAYLQRIRTIAARYPDDPLAMRVLAHIELRFGDGAAADRLLDRLLAASPNDAELLYLKGMRWLMAAESDNPPERAGATARSWFGRAQRADQNHYQTLYRFVQSLRGEAGYLSENTRNALLLARQLAPQVVSIAFNAASLLIARREYAEAIALLMPLVASPHDPGLSRAAREMVERAEAEMRAAAPAARSAPNSAAPAQPPGN
jgi:Flp pilus assembly protein TadD